MLFVSSAVVVSAEAVSSFVTVASDALTALAPESPLVSVDVCVWASLE